MARWILATLLLVVLVGATLLGLAATRDIPLETLETRYTDEHSRFVEVDGLRVHYRDQGSGPVLLLLHGTGASLHTWDGWASELQGQFRVIRMDLPAFGLTGPREDRDYRISAYVDFLADFAGALGLEDFAIAGNSLGGHIAWRYALEYPDQVNAMVLVAPSAYPPADMPRAMRLARTPVMNQLIRHVLSPQRVRDSLEDVYGDPAQVDEALVTRYYELTLRPGNRQAFIDRARTEMTWRHDELGAIDTPALIMWGGRDTWIAPVNGEQMVRDMPRARLYTFPELGHVPMEEDPVRTATLAARFLSGNTENTATQSPANAD